MAQVSISKVINLTQLGQELDSANPPGFKMSWDGASGYVRVLERPDITDAQLQAAARILKSDFNTVHGQPGAGGGGGGGAGGITTGGAGGAGARGEVKVWAW